MSVVKVVIGNLVALGCYGLVSSLTSNIGQLN